MNNGSARQLIQFLTLLDKYHNNGDSLIDSRIRATREVAQQQQPRSLRYPTILDLYTRRLGHINVSYFDARLQEWQTGNSLPLLALIKKYVDPTVHDLIEQFFRNHTSSVATRRITSPPQDHDSESKEFKIQIPQKESEMLLFIAKMKSSDPLQLLIQITSRSIRNEMKALANDI